MPVNEPVVPARAARRGEYASGGNRKSEDRASERGIRPVHAESAILCRFREVLLSPQRILRLMSADGRPPRRARAARSRDLRVRVAARSRNAHADEQPRPGGCRASGRSRRLRRQRPRRALVGGVRRHRAHAAAAAWTTKRCIVQSGKPVAVFKTHARAPRVLIANANLVPKWADWSDFRELEAQGLTMYGQMTAGSWIYIGTQGIVQGTYETFAELARQHFGGSLARTRHADGRRRRDGRRAAARDDDERRHLSDRRRRPHSPGAPPRAALPRSRRRFARRGAASRCNERAEPAKRSRSATKETPRDEFRAAVTIWDFGRTPSPTRPRRTICSTATCPTA